MHVYFHRYHQRADDGIGDDGLGYTDQPFGFEIQTVKSKRHAAGEYQVLIIESGFDHASVSNISRDELVTLRDIINDHLGERSQAEIVDMLRAHSDAAAGRCHDAKLRGDLDNAGLHSSAASALDSGVVAAREISTATANSEEGR